MAADRTMTPLPAVPHTYALAGMARMCVLRRSSVLHEAALSRAAGPRDSRGHAMARAPFSCGVERARWICRRARDPWPRLVLKLLDRM